MAHPRCGPQSSGTRSRRPGTSPCCKGGKCPCPRGSTRRARGGVGWGGCVRTCMQPGGLAAAAAPCHSTRNCTCQCLKPIAQPATRAYKGKHTSMFMRPPTARCYPLALRPEPRPLSSVVHGPGLPCAPTSLHPAPPHLPDTGRTERSGAVPPGLRGPGAARRGRRRQLQAPQAAAAAGGPLPLTRGGSRRQCCAR